MDSPTSDAQVQLVTNLCTKPNNILRIFRLGAAWPGVIPSLNVPVLPVCDH